MHHLNLDSEISVAETSEVENFELSFSGSEKYHGIVNREDLRNLLIFRAT